MRRLSTFSFATLVALTLLGGGAQARHVHPRGDPPPRHYDPATVVAFSGEVIGVRNVAHGSGEGTGVHLGIKTDNGVVDVVLGPAWYVAQLASRYHRGDNVAILGSRVAIDGQPAVIAAEARKGGDRLELRDLTTGAPRWRAGATR
jgi:hypothetical protein